MGQPTISRDDIAKHKLPCYLLSKPVRSWESSKGGVASAEIVIPAGASLVNAFPDVLRSLLAKYGDDRSVGHFILPDGEIVWRFFRLTDAIKALPEEVPDVQWCAETQTYEARGEQ